MADITDEDRALLQAHCYERDGRWAFAGSGVYVHSDASALAIIRACLALGVPVTDKISGEAWGKIVMTMTALEARVAELESSASRVYLQNPRWP